MTQKVNWPVFVAAVLLAANTYGFDFAFPIPWAPPENFIVLADNTTYATADTLSLAQTFVPQGMGMSMPDGSYQFYTLDVTLNNAAPHVISGTGGIATNLYNSGTISASGGTLTVHGGTNYYSVVMSETDPLSGSKQYYTLGSGSYDAAIANHGILQAASGGTLVLNGAIDNSGGIIRSTGGTLDLSGAAISGGIVSCPRNFLDGDTINNAYGLHVDQYSPMQWTGTITNQDNVTVNAGGQITLNNPVTLNGTGTSSSTAARWGRRPHAACE